MDTKHCGVPGQIVSFAGLTFRGATRAALRQGDRPILVVTVNADILVTAHKNHRFGKIVRDNYATLDGQVPFKLARWLGRPRGAPIEKISGSDYVIELLQEAQQQGKRVFLLGAEQDSNARAVEVTSSAYGVQTDGYSPPLEDYPFSDSWREVVRERIRKFRPHFVFVALGCPKQEFWMDDEKLWLREIGVELAIGCGGSVDFLSGKVMRAPKFIQNMGMEGFYRVFTQPKLFRVKRLCRSFLMFKYIFRKV